DCGANGYGAECCFVHPFCRFWSVLVLCSLSDGFVLCYELYFSPFALWFCELCFPVDERGTVKSVVQYFEEMYGFTIHNMTWPCLQVGNPQSPNYLPMEVCKIVEGQRYSKRLNERQIAAL
ncbi:unnamed protein product, partial [Musa textilis]